MKKNRVIQFDDDGKIVLDTSEERLVEYYSILECGRVSLLINVEQKNIPSYDLSFPLYATKKSILAAVGLAEKKLAASGDTSFISFQAQSRMGWPIRMMLINDQTIPIDEIFDTVFARDSSAAYPHQLAHDDAKFRSQLKELDCLLGGLSPNGARNFGRANTVQIDLSKHQYEVLRAALRSIYEFSEVESWDIQVINVIRSLHRILIESRKLLAEASSIAVKPIVVLLDSVSAGLKKMLDEIENGKSD